MLPSLLCLPLLWDSLWEQLIRWEESLPSWWRNMCRRQAGRQMPSFASPGEQLTYTISLTHTATQTAQDITITDVIPQNTGYLEGSATGNPTYDPQQKTLIWQIASLGGGGKEIPICIYPSDQYVPSLYGDKAVWEDHRNGNGDIYMYDISLGQEIPICLKPQDQFSPVIYDEKVIWAEWRNGNPDIYMKDLQTKRKSPRTSSLSRGGTLLSIIRFIA